MVQEEHRENLLRVVRELVAANHAGDAVALITSRHPADQADLIEDLEEEAQEKVLEAMEPEDTAHILEYLNEDLRRRYLEDVAPMELAPILDELEEDVAADIVQDLDPEKAVQVVPLLEDSRNVAELLQHAEETAGGRMAVGLVTLQRDWTVDETINFLRREHPGPDQAYYLYVVDIEERLQGVVSLRDLIIAAPEAVLNDIMNEEVISIPAESDQEVAADRMRHYNLLALPVVDEDGKLLGVITADDVLDVQVEEATEDMYKMAGVGVKEWAFSPVWESAGRRVPWLLFNMVWAFAGATIISIFQDTISQVAALAIFMPMIAGQAGNATIQTATIVVRSMALGELDVGDIMRVLRKEWALGLIKGVLFGGVLGIVAWLWQDHPFFGVVAGTAMFLNMLVASTAGVVVPMTLRRLNIDPATIAGVFDTMVTDFMGFFIYLGLATLFLAKLT